MDITPSRRLIVAASVAPFALFLVVYLLLSRHGFMIDDFASVLQSRVRSVADVASLFVHASEFYRPLVALTFTFDEWLFGTAPFGYGMTNVALALGCAAAIAALGRSLRLSRGASMFFSALWLLNFHGVRTAVLWVSGRSELLVVLCATMTARSVVRRETLCAMAWLCAALLAKEEAVLLPLVLLGWIVILRHTSRIDTTTPIAWLVGATTVLGAYLLVRHAAQAMTLATAPDYYRLTFVPRVVWRHVYIYADEVATFPTLVALCACITLGVLPLLIDRRAVVMGALGTLWVLGGYGLTVFVPSRSDLYTCLPSVGVCLIAAAVCERAWQGASVRRQSLAFVAIIGGCIVLSPVYYLRTISRSRLTGLSDTALTEIASLVANVPEGSMVTVYDDPAARAINAPNLEDAFGSMLNEAYQLKTHRRLRFEIDVPPTSASDLTKTTPRLQLRGGHVTRLP